MLEPGKPQVGENNPIRAQVLEESDFLDLLFKAFDGLARRDGVQPFKVAQVRAGNRRQQPLDPSLPLGPHGRANDLEQNPLMVPSRGNCEAADIAVAKQKIIMVDKPRTGQAHEIGTVERRGRLPAETGNEPPFGVGAEFGPAEGTQSGSLMVEECAPASVEGPDRGDPWWRT